MVAKSVRYHYQLERLVPEFLHTLVTMTESEDGAIFVYRSAHIPFNSSTGFQPIVRLIVRLIGRDIV